MLNCGKMGHLFTMKHQKEKKSVKQYFEAFRTYCQERHGLKIDRKTESHAIVLTDMCARKNYCLGKGNILLAGEAGGFVRGPEGITSALTSGKAAGEAILASAGSGKPALEHYQELASEEMEACNRANEVFSQFFGCDIFTRP